MKKLILLLSIVCLAACKSLNNFPKEKYYAFQYNFNNVYENDTISFQLKNSLMCPMNVRLVEDPANPDLATLFGQVTLSKLQDTIIKIHYPDVQSTIKPKYSIRYGDLQREVNKSSIGLPFPKGKQYNIIQGFKSRFSHNTVFSRYAIDFDLSIGDTIVSVDDGYVVGLIEEYKDHGTSQQWRDNDKSNYLTVYHPDSGLYSQYVHLNHDGAIVELGDYVEKGQPIAISGMTGFTTVEHLHFNVKIPSATNGLISTEYTFDNAVDASTLKKGDVLRNYNE
ncbi:M23 family metallopeptidase [uncultured Dokdonia sp.]|uniref:M23 family metallopeptidase n=1 Tax=Dokdonia sp. R78006 TaxID=3093866 RepID=UPI002624EAF0|nr:M23 family metallopeptidase [uncultured Dokdonia sp.]